MEPSEAAERYDATRELRRDSDQQSIVKLFKTGQVPDRAHFVQANLACIECLHTMASNTHTPVSAIFVLDLRDGDAAAVARLCVPDKQAVRRLVNECAATASIPTAIVALSPDYAAETIGSRFPDLWYEFSPPLPEESFHLIAFAFGGYDHRAHPRRCRCGC
jgi:hypothetical protein